MRKFVKRTAGWIHATLIMAMILPLLYVFGAKQPDDIGRNLFYKCLVIVLPVVVTDLIIRKCKGLLSYLTLSVLILAATAAAGWVVAGSLRQSFVFWIYLFVLLCETMFVIFSRMSERLRRNEEQEISKDTDPTWRPATDSLRTPSFAILIFFVAVYAVAVNLNNPAVCNAALLCAIVYTVITVLYLHVSETENYLALNKRTCNIPSKRIYGIGNGMLAIFMLLFIVVMLPALFTISNRRYRDIRESTAFINIDYTELIEENERQADVQMPMESWMEQFGTPEPPPEWLDTLLYVMEVIVAILITAALVKVIYDTFKSFRATADENGDIVEELEDSAEAVRIKKIHLGRRKLSERERIRKEYRKYIRRYRKERPARYESPTEIERNAGISESEECKKIHNQYELARYRQES